MKDGGWEQKQTPTGKHLSTVCVCVLVCVHTGYIELLTPRTTPGTL